MASGKDVLRPNVPWRDLTTVVAATRVDAVVAAGFNLSRSQVKELIASGQVQVNWLAEGRADAQLVPGDMISVRGHGRVQLVDILGITTKQRWRVALRVLAK
ncbi:S4 domain-containing protein [Lacticaseibacillus sharpeae]|uniref:S4 domain-containing protein n=1 Tax=Lacticaseibacillus sharpeae TaxID=1626 RepID=UPI00138EDB3E|nr:S4 domain-containing protein [Lacticaseibacillus sharpeae]